MWNSRSASTKRNTSSLEKRSANTTENTPLEPVKSRRHVS
jgi:hypothetical protein